MSDAGEIWADVVSYEGLYQISNQGRVKSLSRKWSNSNRQHDERILKHFYSRKYRIIEFSNKGEKRLFYIHILVATYFVGNPDNLPEVNHEDGDTENNSDWNLKWCTRAYNVQHAVDHGLLLPLSGSKNPAAVLTETDIPIIRARRRAGESYQSIAKDYGVDFTNIYHIIKGHTWKHVPITN